MTTSTPPMREAARAIVLDADDRILLLRTSCRHYVSASAEVLPVLAP
ncbi:hypothetical protein [Streptomyces sp. MMG1533]|nr:hypothetical protein [Streptomyces sp. MMG1533]